MTGAAWSALPLLKHDLQIPRKPQSISQSDLNPDLEKSLTLPRSLAAFHLVPQDPYLIVNNCCY